MPKIKIAGEVLGEEQEVRPTDRQRLILAFMTYMAGALSEDRIVTLAPALADIALRMLRP